MYNFCLIFSLKKKIGLKYFVLDCLCKENIICLIIHNDAFNIYDHILSEIPLNLWKEAVL